MGESFTILQLNALLAKQYGQATEFSELNYLERGINALLKISNETKNSYD
jgi:hypothetical protein